MVNSSKNIQHTVSIQSLWSSHTKERGFFKNCVSPQPHTNFTRRHKKTHDTQKYHSMQVSRLCVCKASSQQLGVNGNNQYQELKLTSGLKRILSFHLPVVKFSLISLPDFLQNYRMLVVTTVNDGTTIVFSFYATGPIFNSVWLVKTGSMKFTTWFVRTWWMHHTTTRAMFDWLYHIPTEVGVFDPTSATAWI